MEVLFLPLMGLRDVHEFSGQGTQKDQPVEVGFGDDENTTKIDFQTIRFPSSPLVHLRYQISNSFYSTHFSPFRTK
jgi:hypothetical protein